MEKVGEGVPLPHVEGEEEGAEEPVYETLAVAVREALPVGEAVTDMVTVAEEEWVLEGVTLEVVVVDRLLCPWIP